MFATLKLLAAGAAAATVAYATRIIGPKIRVGDVKLVSTAGLYQEGTQLTPQTVTGLIGAAPFFLFQVADVRPEGAYGALLGAGVPMGVGTDMVQITRGTPFPTGPVPEGAFATNRWQG